MDTICLEECVSSAISVVAYGLLRELLFPGPPTLGSLVALGWRGILWMGLSRLPRSATIVTLPRMGPPRFLPRVSDVDVDRDMDTESWGSLASRCPAHMDFSIWKTARGATFRFSKSTRILNTSGSMAAPAACDSSYSSISSAPSTFFRRSASFCSVVASNPVDTASPAPPPPAAAAIRVAYTRSKEQRTTSLRTRLCGQLLLPQNLVGFCFCRRLSRVVEPLFHWAGGVA